MITAVTASSLGCVPTFVLGMATAMAQADLSQAASSVPICKTIIQGLSSCVPLAAESAETVCLRMKCEWLRAIYVYISLLRLIASPTMKPPGHPGEKIIYNFPHLGKSL